MAPWTMVCALSLSSDQSLLRWLPPLLPRGPITLARECCLLKPYPKDIQLRLLVHWTLTPLGQLERKGCTCPPVFHPVSCLYEVSVPLVIQGTL